MRMTIVEGHAVSRRDESSYSSAIRMQQSLSLSLRFSIEDKAGPVIGRLPTPSFHNLQLSGSERRGRRHSFLENARIKLLHELRGGIVIDLPQAGHHPRGTRVHKSTSEAHNALSYDILSQRGLTRAQDDHIGVKVQIVDLVETEKAVLWIAAFVYQRENQP